MITKASMDQETPERQFREVVDQLASDPSQRDQLIDLLREDHPVFNQRGATTVTRMRGWVLLKLALDGLPEAALPFVLEELDTGVAPYLVATAAVALRSYALKDSSFAPFLVRAIGNIRYRDEAVSLEMYGGYAIGSNGTSAVRELLNTLIWLGPNEVVFELKQLRAGPMALGKKLQPQLEQLFQSLSVETDSSDCCHIDLQALFSSLHSKRNTTAEIELTIFEDQEGNAITFKEFFFGRPSIVVFFYTRCDNPLKCSLTITKLARIQEQLEREGLSDQINTAGITYDPGFDLSERIKNYGTHRGVHFAERHRMLRNRDNLDVLRMHFRLGVNFIESLVNRHRLEVFILDQKGRIVASFERIQWDEQEVVDRAIKIISESSNTNSEQVSREQQRKTFAAPLLTTVAALGLALFPKCPLCWAAYLSLFGVAGLESIPYSPWLQPVLALLLMINLTAVWFRGRSAGMLFPFYLAAFGAAAVIISKLVTGLDAAGIAGVLLTLLGSVWGTLSAANRRQLARP